MSSIKIIVLYFAFILCLGNCRQKESRDGGTDPSLFVLLDSDSTGLNFSNTLSPTNDLNIFSYMYFYNGGGVGIADLNNDGLQDIVFTGNQVSNELFINKGNLKFEVVTKQAGLQSQGWSTGVNFVDINTDGLMDIYITQVNNGEKLLGRHLLYICMSIDDAGIPHYVESAEKYGLDFKGFGTQSAFFDYDLDGDLDVYLLNHSIHKNGTFGNRKVQSDKYHDKSGDRLYRNDNGIFTDVTQACGIYSNALGYGLGIKVADINLDGWPDIYIGNDFHENDYLYINQKNGSFAEQIDQFIMHTSRYTMGVDIADFNNDLYPDIFTLDMHPNDYKTLKMSEGEDLYNIFQFKLSLGYNQQYSRNTLQLNRQNGFFSEIGIFSGVFASDWSWSTFFADFNNDGNKDIFISNGIPKKMNDIDYIDFVVDDVIQNKIREKKMDESDLALLGKLPEIKIENKLYLNTDSLRFTDGTHRILGHLPSFSNGAAYADLDNDGDLDIVTNNINDKAFLYKNLTVDSHQVKLRKVILKGPISNPQSIGAKLIVFAGNKKCLYEHFVEKGFQSSMLDPISVGTWMHAIDSLLIIWPDNSFQTVFPNSGSKDIMISYNPKSKIKFDYSYFSEVRNTFNQLNIVDTTVAHIEYPFAEFDREALMPFMTSTEGPALAVADINKDGKSDVFLGGSRYNKGKVLLHNGSGWSISKQEDIDSDSMYEDVVAVFADFDNDGDDDLLIGSGGSEFYNKSEYNVPRLYLNDGSGYFKRNLNAFSLEDQLTASCLIVDDINRDGFKDLFIGARSVPWAYGSPPYSKIFINVFGTFKDSTFKYLKNNDLGMVKSAQSIDFDQDGDNDILLAIEWEPLKLLRSENGVFLTKSLSTASGLWNCAKAVDLDGDGDLDIFAGNIGLNTKFKASENKPLRMYYGDFDQNEKKEQAITYYYLDNEVPFAGFKEIIKQMPSKKKDFQFARQFASLGVKDIFQKNLSDVPVFVVNELASVIFENIGNGGYRKRVLPDMAQLSIIKDLEFVDIDTDGDLDILPVSNYFETNTQLGRIDADPGIVLLNNGSLSFSVKTFDKPILKGQSRRIIKNGYNFYIAKNNGKLTIIKFPNK